MSNNEKQCLIYFTNVIQGEKQTELSPVSIADLGSYLLSAQVNIRRHIKSVYGGDLVEFFKRFPEIFQLEGTKHVYLTSDIMKKYGVDELEKMAVDFLKSKLKAMNAYHFSPVPLMALRKCLGEAPLGVQALMAKNYPAKDMRRLLQAYPDIFGVSNSGNVYLLGEAPRPLDDCNFQNYWSSDTSCLDGEISQDEADAVRFFRQVLNSPGIELESCSVDSLFAQVCEAPDNVQHFIKSNYTEVNFLDFFRAHKSAFSVTTGSSPPETLDGNDDEESDEEEFPPLPNQENDYLEKSSDDAWEPSHGNGGPINAEAAAIKYFEDVIKTRMQENELTHVDQLRQRLADAPLIVFSYFSDEYPYGKFDKFFLDHPDHFSIERTGVVELASTAKERASNAGSSSSSTSEGRVSGCEDSAGALHARNVQVEKLLEKYFADLFHLAYSYGVRVVKPETALEISSCLNRRLTGYLSDSYGKNVVEFFQHYQSRFRVSKNGNICLAVEKDLSTDTTAKKQPNVLAVEFYVALMQLLEAHQVKAISPEVLWSFLPLTPPKVQGYLCKVYTKDNFKSFFLKAPTKFAMSKNKNVYLSSGSGCSKRDSSDVDEYDFESASENTHEASALEHFVDLIKSLRVNTYPVPISMLQEHLQKASSFVKDYFEDVYPQEKFVNFFLKYNDFFYVLQPINVVWLTKIDGGEVADVHDEVCPLDTMPSSFRLVVGVVAAALLVKSPKPFSTILGHLNIVKDQYSQELNKQPGKSKTEKLCSLVSNCFDMFKIVKDNTILSWPLKYASSLLSALEDALAEVCVKLAAEDIVEVSNFHGTLRRNTERLFQCLIPDIKALLEFLHRREEFFVLDKEHFIVVPRSAVPEDTEEIAQMLEKELLKCTDSKAPLFSVLENLKDEGFDHHFSSSTVLKAVLTRKDRFEICDDLLLLIEEQKESSGKRDSGDHGDMGSGGTRTGIKPEKTNCTPVNGMGWIISLDGESGLLAATFGSSDDYAEVIFKRDALSATSTNYNELIVGQEVEFIAVKDNDESEWVIVELKSAGSTPCGEEEKEGSEQGKRAHPSSGGKHRLDISDAASDDNASTNGDDCIFYSSASDSEPVKLAAPPLTDHDTEKVKSPNFKNLTTEEVVQNGNAPTQEGTLDDSADTTIVDDGYDDCDWDTPYDRRIMDLRPFPMTEAFELCEKTIKCANSEEQSPQGVLGLTGISSMTHHAPQSVLDAILPKKNNHVPCATSPAISEPTAIQSNAATSHEAPKESLTAWAGTGIWDIEPLPAASKGQLQQSKLQLANDDIKVDEKRVKDFNTQKVPEENGTHATSASPTASVKASRLRTGSISDSSMHGAQQSGSRLYRKRQAVETTYSDESSSSSSRVASSDIDPDLSADDESEQETDYEISPSTSPTKQSVKPEGNHLAAGDNVLVSHSDTDICSHSEWCFDEDLPFANATCDRPDVAYSIPATVALVTPTVAILESTVRGVPVSLIADPAATTSRDWSELHVGKKVAARALGNIEDSTLLLVVKLRPLWRKAAQRATLPDAATQTISTGPVLSASLLVE
ncbi:uncharacterized protein LOC119383136 [Rhipicephalus sanguineus]|uniref:uncharacterized protein LOC119383136 n=1 Tax=Rhipicephalus sanguineus TaxID=34632 RepID=UPI0018950AA1|nr:uncharacterized protein LOC119383136 [Rhipicephalus sanguineus]